ncbi:MAG: molybdenum cofactor guanylyltransferase [Pseudomonadota bacterium]
MKPISEKCSGVILAGGMSTRFNGRDKATIEISGKRILDHILAVYSEVFTEIILVTNAPQAYLDWNMLMVTDLFPVRSSLTGIHAGLFYASRPFVFVSACDAPFLKQELVHLLISQARPGVDAVMPETAKGLEPLCAVYSKSCLNTIETHIHQEKLKIQRVFHKSRINRISEARLRKADPDLISFVNINTPEDLMRVASLEKESL